MCLVMLVPLICTLRCTGALRFSVSGPLSARAGAAPTAGDAPVTAAFFGSASGGTLPYSFTWSLGDGTTSNAQNPSHLYVTAGTYTATLTVTDAQNHSAAAQATVDVSPTLTASDSVSPGSGTAPLPVAFTANTSGGKAPFSYRWAFGDGATSISQNPAHSYGVPGTFTVSAGATANLSNTGFAPPFFQPVTFNNSGIVNWNRLEQD